MKSPQFTDFGLDAPEAFAIASHMGWTNALANAVIRGYISLENAEALTDEAADGTSTLMLGDKLDEGTPSEQQLVPGNPVFERVTNDLADELFNIAEAMEQQEQNDAV